LVEILGKVFDTEFLPKYFYGVVELPLPRNAQKRTPKKSQGKKKSDGGWVGLRFSKCTGGFVDFVLAAPRAKAKGQGASENKIKKERGNDSTCTGSQNQVRLYSFFFKSIFCRGAFCAFLSKGMSKMPLIKTAKEPMSTKTNSKVVSFLDIFVVCLRVSQQGDFKNAI
jgi:hypothetical protein